MSFICISNHNSNNRLQVKQVKQVVLTDANVWNFLTALCATYWKNLFDSVFTLDAPFIFHLEDCLSATENEVTKVS